MENSNNDVTKSRRPGEFTVNYEHSSHLQVLLQVQGSNWADCLPYCLATTLIYIVLFSLKEFNVVNLSISSVGHNIMNIIVSFLIVSRVTMALNRYDQARGYIDTMYAESRNLVQYVVLFTGKDTTLKARKWRHEVAYQMCLLLRLTMAVIDYEEDFIPPWNLPLLQDPIRSRIIDILLYSERWTHQKREEREMVLRVPTHMVQILRETIYHDTTNEVQQQCQSNNNIFLESWQYENLFNKIDNFIQAYNNQRKFMTTPFPFSLVQMARTIMFLWLFSLPLALIDLDSSDDGGHIFHRVVSRCVMVFFITYGFIGLESVSIQLDNPFGYDENDFDNLGMAYCTFEDIYAIIYRLDGIEWTDKLRLRMKSDYDEKDFPETADEETKLIF